MFRDGIHPTNATHAIIATRSPRCCCRDIALIAARASGPALASDS
jgi:hypothetical protein